MRQRLLASPYKEYYHIKGLLQLDKIWSRKGEAMNQIHHYQFIQLLRWWNNYIQASPFEMSVKLGAEMEMHNG